MHQRLTQEMEKCIKDCLDCHSICLTTIQHCLQKGGRHADPSHIGLLLNCAEICQTSTNFMLSGSHFHVRTCAVCAEICEACAKSCEQFEDDPQMRSCAEVCRRCADSCRKMGTRMAA